MMRLFFPILLGVASVAQAGMNRRLASGLGLPAAIVLNNLVLLGASVAFFLARRPVTPTRAFAPSVSFLAPGLLGMLLVAGIPWAISRWGATVVFIGLIGSQVVSSLAWDAWAENRAIDAHQIAGVALTLAGTALTTLRR